MSLSFFQLQLYGLQPRFIRKTRHKRVDCMRKVNLLVIRELEQLDRDTR